MKCIKDIGSHKNKIGNKVIPLSLALVILVVSTFPVSSLQFIKPAMAAGLTGVYVVPASNIVNERATYDIFLKPATTATIETIEMNFPASFDLTAATRLIENSGIGSGSLSVTGSTLKYTVSSPVSVPAGTSIRLEIGRIVATTADRFTVSISTLNTASSIIDGPTPSSSIIIKDITGNDVSPNFMIRKTLNDDAAGNALGWNPDGLTSGFVIDDNDLSGEANGVMVSVAVHDCVVAQIVAPNHFAVIQCDTGPPNGTTLEYLITKLPPHVVTSSSLSSTTTSSTSSTISSPFSLLGEH
jgi:hypothetical protein